MEIFKGKEMMQKATMEDNVRRFIDRNYVLCSSRCFTRLTSPKMSINEERCLASCMELRNHFFFDEAVVLQAYLGTGDTPTIELKSEDK